MWEFLLVLIASIAFKMLFMFSYHSTDFEVHRNWIAITCSLPVSEWYYEKTSQWTLDYPPLFAWLEWCLSKLAVMFDSNICVLSSTPYVSKSVVVFQRISVVMLELVMFLALLKFFASVKHHNSPFMKKNSFLIWLIFNFNFGLILIDRILHDDTDVHFQYNGFLFGILLLSIAYLFEEKYIVAALCFTILLNFKHIFLYVAPAYFVHILLNYCFASNGFKDMFKRFMKVSTAVLLVTFISFGPFIYMMKQLMGRLFPFHRGLTHAYWAPNFWSLYNFADKILTLLDGQVLHGKTKNVSCSACMTGGLVEDIEHIILPSIRPLHTGIISFLFMLVSLVILTPTLISSVKESRLYREVPIYTLSDRFFKSLIVSAWSFYTFGWHVHEKAILMILLPLNLYSLLTGKYRFLTFYISTLGYYSLIPLIPTRAEFPAVVSLYLTHTCVHWLILFRVHSINKIKKNVQVRTHRSKFEILCIKLASLYLWGLVILFVSTQIILPKTYLNIRYPFVPLMLTSVYTSFGIFLGFISFIWSTIYDSQLSDNKNVKTDKKSTINSKKLKTN